MTEVQRKFYGPMPAEELEQFTTPAKVGALVVAGVGEIGTQRECGCQERGTGPLRYLSPCMRHTTIDLQSRYRVAALPKHLSENPF